MGNLTDLAFIIAGTYYNDEDREDTGALFSPYYSNNGHGRPYSQNPRPQKYSNGDFFANFRDFADINTPTKASFSEFVIVYVNKNGSLADRANKVDGMEASSRPNNIIEQLSLLDKQQQVESATNQPQIIKPAKKMSSNKRKLALMQEEKTNKTRKMYLKKKDSSKEVEPLLALS